MQQSLALALNDIVAGNVREAARPFSSQLLKWIGNKQRQAPGIISFFPSRFGTYFEPFLGSAGVLGVLAPNQAEGSDSFGPLIEIWSELCRSPREVKRWYRERYALLSGMEKQAAYEWVKASYNARPNGPDLLFLSRSCYGGVVRFRQKDGYMSTPVGAHQPMSPESFEARVDQWYARTSGTAFYRRDYQEAFKRAKAGDLIYCDPPYSHSQAILYGAQTFNLKELYAEIRAAKLRGVYVALSIDGQKKSGDVNCDVHIPTGLFQREVGVNVGRSMLKRFQMEGQSLESEVVTDRLLLTY